jgi:hypothetical protein
MSCDEEATMARAKLDLGGTEIERRAWQAIGEHRRWQRCPDCGTFEAAGTYCTRCLRQIDPDDWIADEAAKARARERFARGGARIVRERLQLG